jgi:two-component system sensor histidine kinase GlrK
MRYPRSFIRLLLIGFTLVALPLIGALVTSAIAVDRLTNRSQIAVYGAVQATQSSRRLGELLTALERSARQIVILNDRSLLDAYASIRAQFLEMPAQFAALRLDADRRADLDSIMQGEQEIFSALSDPRIGVTALQARVRRFGELAERARGINAWSSALIDREVETMHKAAGEAQRLMLWQTLALVPVLIFLVGGFAVLIARPIGEIDAAIREIGDGRLHRQVSVHGPADLEQLGERLEWMRQRLIDLEQQKNRLLQEVSHDLKTPLTALREGTQLLTDDVVGRLTGEQREIVQILRQNSIELQRRIEKLLDLGAVRYQQINNGPLQLHPRGLIDAVAQAQKLALQAKGLTLQTTCEDLTLSGDPVRLHTVLDNLLSNAIRYSPEGGVIRMTAGRDGDCCVIDVIDQGPGIDAAERAHVFEPFYRGRLPGSGPVKGSGLGLSIVREYVAAHGGSVEALAADGASGAHFRVVLPLVQRQAA